MHTRLCFQLPRNAIVLLLAVGTATGLPVDALSAQPTFEIDVMAVLSKAGCNAGTCHGNQNGKGGFRLSLRGQKAEFDYRWLVRDSGGRRVDRLTPERSLILRKPAGELAHEGGVRFRRNSLEYRILHEWLADGAPGPGDNTPGLKRIEVTPRAQVVIDPEAEVQLKVTAHFSDGHRRDVTRLAVYETTNLNADADHFGLVARKSFGETTVMVRFLNQQVSVQLAFIPARTDFEWSDPPANNYIDDLTFAKLRTLRVNPSKKCDDHVFVRRVYLDAIGMLPTADEARRFVADTRSNKRAELIDALLERTEFADLWALKWSDILRNEEKVLDPKGVEVFHAWIRDDILQGKPVDQFVRELILGEGSTYKIPPANFWRANRDPLTRGETTARLFLGTRMQCAKCHNHPFGRWTQDDYYSWAALFARLDYKLVDNKRQDKLDKNEFNGEQIVLVKDSGEVTHPETGATAPPKLLGDRILESGSDDDRLKSLAEWLTAPDNDLFAKSQANFIWYHLMGRGLVEPIDDFRVTNPAVNPPLLDALARDFVEHDFDLRHLVRRILNSRVYQLSSEPNETNADDESNFSHAIVRRLPAEVLLDAQSQVLDAPAEFNGYPRGMRAVQIPGVRKVRRRSKPPADGDRFLVTFGKPERQLACECERSNETTLKQAFVFISGAGLNQRLGELGNRLETLVNRCQSDGELITELFWTALSRPPSNDELQAAKRMLTGVSSEAGTRHGERFAAVQDLAWALLNAKEFIFRR